MVLPYTSNASTRYVVSVWAGGLSVKDASSTREARVPRELRLGPSQVSNHRLFCLFGGTWGAAHGHYCIGACTTASLILRTGSGAEAEKRVRQGVRAGNGLCQCPKNKQTNKLPKKGPHPPPCPALPLFLLPSYRTTTTGPPTTTPRDERHRPPSFCYRKMGCPRTREDKSGARQRGADEPPP